MEKRIARFGIHKTSLTSAVIVAITTTPLFILIGIPAFLSGDRGFLIAIVVAPILYFIFGYIFMAFWCWVYNMLTKKTKLGIVITLDDTAQKDD